MILCYGHEIVMRILIPIQIWIMTGNFEEAFIFYQKYSFVPEKFLIIKNLIGENFIPRKLHLFDNLELNEGNMKIEIKEYPETIEGIIQSFVDR